MECLLISLKKTRIVIEHIMKLYQSAFSVKYGISNINCVELDSVYDVRGCIRKFPDWSPGSRTANCTALCH